MNDKCELEKGYATFYPYNHDQICSGIAIASTADKVCRRVFNVISEYEQQIDDESEVGLMLFAFGFVNKIVVESIGWIGSNLIEFIGYPEEGKGEKVHLVQHISQLNFLLCTIPKKSDCPRRVIELRVWDETKVYE